MKRPNWLYVKRLSCNSHIMLVSLLQVFICLLASFRFCCVPNVGKTRRNGLGHVSGCHTCALECWYIVLSHIGSSEIRGYELYVPFLVATFGLEKNVGEHVFKASIKVRAWTTVLLLLKILRIEVNRWLISYSLNSWCLSWLSSLCSKEKTGLQKSQKIQEYLDAVAPSLSGRISISVLAGQVATLSIAGVCNIRLSSSREISATLGLCKMLRTMSHLWIYSKTSNMHINADAKYIW